MVRARKVVGSTSIFLTIAGGLLAALSIYIGLAATLQVSVSFIVLAVLPGAAVVRRLFARPSLLHYVILGAVVGLALLSLGGMFSHITDAYWVRWLPSAAGLVLWLLPRRSLSGQSASARSGFPALGGIGAILGLIALLPSLKTVLLSQPTHWSGWHNFYSDLPFHVAITSEIATRAPQEYPWVADVPLSYTWLFHSAMGVWASASDVAASAVVLQAWPVLFTIVIPAVLALTAWEITHNKYVAMVSPLAYVVLQGLVLAPARMHPGPLFQISPTRDFAALFILLAVLSLIRLLGHRSLRTMNPWWFLVLGIATFVAAGAKGSAMPILLGGALSAILALTVLRRVRTSDFLVLAVFAAAAGSSVLLTLPEAGSAQSLSWGPLTFLDPGTPGRSLVSIIILALLAFAILGLWVVIGTSGSGGWMVSSLISGVAAAGVVGLGCLTHSGYSQLYFWQSAQPLFAITLAWGATLLIGTYGRAIAVAGLSILFVSNVLWLTTQRVAIVGVAIVVMAVCAIVVVNFTSQAQIAQNRRRSRARRLWMAIAIVGVLTQSAQFIAIPTGTSGGATSEADDAGAIHQTQLLAFQYIRFNSNLTDKVITNKHGLSGTLEEGNCDSRWFAIAAWSQRSVLVEGWAYTQNGRSSAWVENDLDLSDRFITSPTDTDKARLQSLGVKYVYVDKRNAYSTKLASVSNRVYESRWANVYSLE